MRDDDAVPIGGRSAGQESLALVLREIGFVGDQDFGVRVEGQEFPARLREAMAGTTIIALVMRPRRFCSMIAAAMLNVLPAPTAWAM